MDRLDVVCGHDDDPVHAGQHAGRPGHQHQRGRGVVGGHFGPAHALSPRMVHQQFEAQGLHVELLALVLITDRYRNRLDLHALDHLLSLSDTALWQRAKLVQWFPPRMEEALPSTYNILTGSTSAPWNVCTEGAPYRQTRRRLLSRRYLDVLTAWSEFSICGPHQDTISLRQATSRQR